MGILAACQVAFRCRATQDLLRASQVPQIDLISICKHFAQPNSRFLWRKSRTAILQDLSLHIRSGERLVLLGQSGCGKTTLLRIIAGLEQPDSGKVLLDEKDAARVPPAQRQVGLVFQSMALYPHLTVDQHLRLPQGATKNVSAATVGGSQNANKSSGPLAEWADWREEILAMLELDSHRTQKPGQLSGGQQQRLAIARALIRRPAILLLDEPLGHLDAHLRKRTKNAIAAILDRLKITTIIVTHDHRDAIELADRIAVMDQGKILQIGTLDQLKTAPVSSVVTDLIDG